MKETLKWSLLVACVCFLALFGALGGFQAQTLYTMTNIAWFCAAACFPTAIFFMLSSNFTFKTSHPTPRPNPPKECDETDCLLGSVLENSETLQFSKVVQDSLAQWPKPVAQKGSENKPERMSSALRA